METVLPYQTPSDPKEYRLEFFGKGSEYFSIMIINWLLTLITLGLYYPWARAKKLQYIYGQTSLNDERFHFSGTGQEMFRGFIKLILFYLITIAIYIVLMRFASIPFFAILFLYAVVIAVIPYAIHGAYRYRMSRTTYRGIRFGYRGDRQELAQNFYKWFLLTILTLGIYGFWMQMNLRRYTHNHIRYGDVNVVNTSDGSDWFILNLKGYFLTVITLGIYSFWWIREAFDYYVNTMGMSRGEEKVRLYSTATAGGFFSLLVVNFFLIVFTLGLGTAWADMRTRKYICDNIKIRGNIDLDSVTQTEEEYTNALGEDVLDFFDIDLA